MFEKGKYSVKLIGKDGNAYAIMGEVCRAMRKHGATDEETAEFMKEAKSGDYDNLLRVCCEYFNVT